jgi:tRNA threonylcarbamoyl adenosine modification protein YeaZ
MVLMNIKNKVYLAIDTAYSVGVVVVFCENSVLFSKSLAHKMSHGKEICRAIDEACQFCHQQNLVIDALLVGLGPGSFVGIRIGLATALGFAFAKGLPLMGFCSHQALAQSVDKNEQAFRFFMKASGSLGYFSSFLRQGGILTIQDQIQVLPSSDLLTEGAKIFSDMPDNFEHIKKAQIQSLLGPSSAGVMRAAALRLTSPIIDESDFIKPNYVKPPNVSSPRAW